MKGSNPTIVDIQNQIPKLSKRIKNGSTLHLELLNKNRLRKNDFFMPLLFPYGTLPNLQAFLR